MGRLLKGSDDGYHPLEIYSSNPFKLTANPGETRKGSNPADIYSQAQFFGSKTVITEAELLWLKSDHFLVLYTA